MVRIRHSSLHRGLEKVSEILKDGKSVFSGKGMPDMFGLRSKPDTEK